MTKCSTGTFQYLPIPACITLPPLSSTPKFHRCFIPVGLPAFSLNLYMAHIYHGWPIYDIGLYDPFMTHCWPLWPIYNPCMTHIWPIIDQYGPHISNIWPTWLIYEPWLTHIWPIWAIYDSLWTSVIMAHMTHDWHIYCENWAYKPGEVPNGYMACVW